MSNAALLLRERSALPRARALLARVPANDTHGDRSYVFMANFYGALGDIGRAMTWVELGQRVYPDNRQLRELQSALAASGVHPPRP